MALIIMEPKNNKIFPISPGCYFIFYTRKVPQYKLLAFRKSITIHHIRILYY